MRYNIIIKQARDVKKDIKLLPKLRHNCNLIGIKSTNEVIEKSIKDKIESLIMEREAAEKVKILQKLTG